MRFDDLRLCEPILRAVRAAGYEHPTPIQIHAIPPVLAGRDVLGCAQTGTGKTAAFALPILQRLSERGEQGNLIESCAAAPKHERIGHTPGGGRRAHATHRDRATHTVRHDGATQAPASQRLVRALVLCPTRELAQQIHDSFRDYGQHTAITQAVVFGGVNQNPQARALRAGVDVLIATPGRLLDLMNQGYAVLSGVEILVLDEADRMLDMGFLPDVRRIVSKIPRKRQTLMFSATMPAPIRELADDLLDDAACVEVARVSSAAPTVDHKVHYVRTPEKPALLTRLLEHTPHTRALVFTRTKRGADKLTRHLVQSGVRASALHGNKSQGARTRALAEFRSAATPVLVATDIAARGLDVDDISHVFNYDLTADPETYVHRIGRTGRAGASGSAVSFCTDEDRGSLRAIERLICQPLRKETVQGGPPPVESPQTRSRQSRTPQKRSRQGEISQGAPRNRGPINGESRISGPRPGKPQKGRPHQRETIPSDSSVNTGHPRTGGSPTPVDTVDVRRLSRRLSRRRSTRGGRAR